MPRKGGLGRGLDALIPSGLPAPHRQEQAGPSPSPAPASASTPAPVTGHAPTAQEHSLPAPSQGLTELPVDAIVPNPHQPRQAVPQQELEELATSIREHGVLQPLVVTRAGASRAGGYTLIAGERRWRAAMLAGLRTVPAIIKEASSAEMLELALVENLQRADLNPLEEASAYRSLVEEFGLKQEEVAARVGKSRQAVANALRLLRLPAPAQQALAQGLISEGHARALLQVPDEELQLRLLERIVADGLSVRQVEELARRLARHTAHTDSPPPEPQQPLYDPVRELEDRFRNALGTRVQLSKSRRGGRLVIYFYSDEELDRIYQAIVGDDRH